VRLATQATTVQEEPNAIRSHVTRLREAATSHKTIMKSQKNPGNTKKRAQANRLKLRNPKTNHSMKSNQSAVVSKLQPRKDLLVPKKNGSMVSLNKTNALILDEEYRRQLLTDLSGKGEHDYYFGSYSSFHIHEEMLKDSVRTRTY
jgi:hypothetical protein